MDAAPLTADQRLRAIDVAEALLRRLTSAAVAPATRSTLEAAARALAELAAPPAVGAMLTTLASAAAGDVDDDCEAP